MLKETVDVVDVVEGKIKVKFRKKESCSGCVGSHICRVDKDQTVLIDNPDMALDKGDRVEVGIEESKNLLAVAISFIIPAIIFVVCLIIFRTKGELISFSLAIIALFVYYLIVKLVLKNKGKQFNLKVLRRVQ